MANEFKEMHSHRDGDTTIESFTVTDENARNEESDISNENNTPIRTEELIRRRRSTPIRATATGSKAVACGGPAPRALSSSTTVAAASANWGGTRHRAGSLGIQQRASVGGLAIRQKGAVVVVPSRTTAAGAKTKRELRNLDVRAGSREPSTSPAQTADSEAGLVRARAPGGGKERGRKAIQVRRRFYAVSPKTNAVVHEIAPIANPKDNSSYSSTFNPIHAPWPGLGGPIPALLMRDPDSRRLWAIGTSGEILEDIRPAVAVADVSEAQRRLRSTV
ncbi:hypothetical protein CC1G_07863 [Coprinopsis cinerea okayama7|uniref:Uncharacterized protein n=1 Tax=Coprinopsis cinerea (strain Okayama-7 / 130 / ATCC MYA-4618 / FGSC 9003) TaxID=240176 RepID=A8P438_COPC7|nr:hypothetical protein CC1G_07863 [Coprinopsis cinerea okayama7\|eukprot:XP_001838672.1 hypothetical protein CC1G_07863 [Coprinopsis cinerea okayama7\